MDKNEYNQKLEEIDRYVSQGNYSEAAKTADSIDWRRVRNVRTLCMISEIYEADNRYEDSKTLLLRAYRRSPVGRAILYRLVEVTIHLKQFDEAIEYYSEYVQAAPHDNNKYILKYKIYKGRGSSLDEQIDILNEYLSQEYTEKWAYELAKLYQQAGRIPECLAACDDLVLWFHNGKYVIKALELKRRYAALTPKQQEIYDHRFDDAADDEERLGQEKQIVETTEDALAETILDDTEKEIAQTVSETAKKDTKSAQIPEETPLDEPIEDAQEFDEQLNKFNTQDLQTELVKSMREIVYGVGRRPEEEESAEDQVIEQSRKEQELATAEKEPQLNLQMPSRMQMKDIKPAQAGQLSIDDILLSMGERGDAMREMAARAAEDSKSQASGVVSAMDEALMGMGVNVKAEPETEQDKIAMAKTRRIPTDEIAEIHASYGLDENGSRISEPVPEKETDDDTRYVEMETDTELSEPEGTEGFPDDQTGKGSGGGYSAQSRPEPEGAKGFPDDQTGKGSGGGYSAQNRPEPEGAKGFPDDQTGKGSGGGYSAQSRPEPEGAKGFPDDQTGKGSGGGYSDRNRPEPEGTDTFPDGLNGEKGGDEDGIQSRPEPGRAEGSSDDLTGEGFSNRHDAQDQPGQEGEENAFADSASWENTEDASGSASQGGAGGARPRLREYQRGLFEGFLGIQNMEEQIAYAIAQAEQRGDDRTSRTGNILIFGGHGCGKTTIATNIAKAIAQDTGSQFVKMARIYASDFNRKDVASTIAKIANGTLIIEEAGDLEDGVVDQLTTAMEFRTDGLLVILEDEQRYIHDLLMRHPRFTMKFTSQIFIPVFTNDELVRFGQIYAAGEDYSFSEGASSALYERISSVSATGNAVSITNVIELVDQAIHRANKFFRKLTGGKKRYDANNCIILLEKDFR